MLFSKDRQGRRGGGVALYVSDQLKCMELCLGMDEDPTKSSWVRVKGRAGTDDIIVWGSATGHQPRKTEQMRPLRAASR